MSKVRSYPPAAGPGGDIPRRRWPRRQVLGFLTVAGIGSVLSRRTIVALAAEKPQLTSEMIERAEWIHGIDFTPEERELMLEGVNSLLEDFAKVRAVELPNDVPPAFKFEVLATTPDPVLDARGVRARSASSPGPSPQGDEDLAYAGIGDLSRWLREKRVSSVELTRLYLERLRRYDPHLLCVINLTEERAMRAAARADRELAAGTPRGPLHGIPWGAKDLLAVSGYPTTWGATPYRDQHLAGDATVVARLDAAGAVLAAKLSVGALAWGDVWFGGTTKSPWNVEQGSSGSSAGPAAATAAGLVGFAIGTETWGSIVSPSTRCGVSGLRPTFGRVSRHGAMALSWSMDKIGPMARSIDDCALVFDAIHGADGMDSTAVGRPFAWPPLGDPRKLRVGFAGSLFEEDRSAEAESDDERKRVREEQSFDRRTLAEMREVGFRLVPIELPAELPVDALSFILTAEASAAFDELTRGGRDDQLVRQIARAWPNVFRQGQTVSAVEYIRANRVRTLLMREMERLMASVDVYVSPTFGGSNLLLTNLTGHPQVVVPNGFREDDGTPTSITFTGRLFGETELLAVAGAYQRATDYHRRRPPLERISVFSRAQEPSGGVE